MKALLNNSNIRVFFHADAPQLQRLADVHDLTPLGTYQRNEGLPVKTDDAAGRRVVGQVNVQNMHDALQMLLTVHGRHDAVAAMPYPLPAAAVAQGPAGTGAG